MLNNPLIPGDPYSYDLNWLVAKVNEILAQLGTLDEAIEKKIFEGFLEHSVVQFKTVAEMLAADITDGSIVLTLGYHEAGDLGSLFYLVKDFNPSQCALDYFLTMDNNAQIAIPVIVTPYVTPEMFGAYGDGATDDSDPIRNAFNYGVVVLKKDYVVSTSIPLKADQTVLSSGTITLTSNASDIFTASDIDNFKWVGGTVKSNGTDTPSNRIFTFDRCENIHIEDVNIHDIPFTWAIRFNAVKNSKIVKNTIEHYSYGGIGLLNGCDDILIDGNSVKYLDVPGDGNGYPIMLSGGETATFNVCANIVCVNNYIENTMVRWEGIDAHGGKNITISNNIVKGCRMGISAFNEKGNYPYDMDNLIVSNNTCISPDSSDLYGYGITVGGNNIVVSGNIIKDFDTTPLSSGIYSRYGSNVIIQDNTVKSCACGLTLSDNINGVTGPTVIRNNIFDTCGRRTQTNDSSTMRVLDTQLQTIITDNLIIKADGVFRASTAALAGSYVRYERNIISDAINPSFGGNNEIITDRRSTAPSNANTKMGLLGDIVSLETPRSGNAFAWICTSPWDGTSATWTPLIVAP